EVLHHHIVHLKALRSMVTDDVALGKIEQRIMLKNRVLEVVALDGRNLNVGCDAPTPVDRPASISQLHFAARVAVLSLTIEIVVIERDVGIVALNQASTRRVVL